MSEHQFMIGHQCGWPVPGSSMNANLTVLPNSPPMRFFSRSCVISRNRSVAPGSIMLG